MERRNFMKLSGGVGATLFYGSFFAPSALFANKDELLGFKAIKASIDDTVIVPEGYEVKPLISWGDPLFSDATPFDESKTINQQAINNALKVFGDNTDGMKMFALQGNRAIIAVNNEYINPELMFVHQGKNMSLDDVKYEQNSLGVSIFEVERGNDGFYKVVIDSKYNRRITAQTPMLIDGPASGDERMKTQADAQGTKVLGTFNNCASGQTPWGTYLTCEENFDTFFGTDDKNYSTNTSEKRYGVGIKDEYNWKLDERFSVSKNPHEPNRFGWVVEIDPYDPQSTPIKRTALGRFKHENAEITISQDGYVVVYMGDDEANEFLYKFISKDKFDAKNPQKNKNLLSEGTLYVAKLTTKKDALQGNGIWIELTHNKNGLNTAAGFKSQADVLIDARLAASKVGATPLDRPEWIAIDPKQEMVYMTLTNNSKRTEEQIDGANPRAKNVYGQILRWKAKNNDHTTTEFEWDIFLLAGNPLKYPHDLRKGTKNITVDNMFNSPDGLLFDKFGRLWIQTDGKYSNKDDFEGMGNNQMLCANPLTGEVRRFLTGPIGCEITGLILSEDCKTMLVGIQHPGEKLTGSHYPNGGNSTPRSTIVQIKKTDGGVLGS